MVHFAKLPWKMIAIGLACCALVSMAVILLLIANLPAVDQLRDVQFQIPLKIYTADNKLIAEYGDHRRTPIKLDQIPQKLKDAVIATEDHRFYDHPGVDLRGIARAFVALATKGTKEQGGSTITMQVARNFFLSRNKTYTRKINEILLALKIERELSKDEILELYLNKIYFGKRAYGVAAAAEVYYGTTVDQLTLGQIAVLAGLPQAPSAINPLKSPEGALKRRTHVLDRMRAAEYITNAEYIRANEESIDTVYHSRPIDVEALYVAEMVRQNMVEAYGEEVYDRGYQVFTTIDSNMQLAANHALTKSLLEYDQRHGFRGPLKNISLDDAADTLEEIPSYNSLIPTVVAGKDSQHVVVRFKDGSENHAQSQYPLKIGDVVYVTQSNNKWSVAQLPNIEGALVAISPHDGSIKALVGGFDHAKSNFNRATQAARQPGSCFKPFIYATALENDYTPATIINDAPIMDDDPNNEDWRPQNHTREFYGPTRLREGLTRSRNLVSIRLLQSLGMEQTLDTMTSFGFNPTSLPQGLSLALGTNTLSPLELASAYCIFPSGGYKIDPYLIQQIQDSHNHEIFAAQVPATKEQVLSAQSAYMITSILQDVVQNGGGRRAMRLGRHDLAGKTGTTNDQVDGWFAGYNQDLVVTTWVGYDDPKSTHEYGVSSALPMWVYFMEKALKNKPDSLQPQPPGLVTTRIDPKTGLLARPGQTDAMFEIFRIGTEPKQVASESSSNPNQQIDDSLIEVDTLF